MTEIPLLNVLKVTFWILASAFQWNKCTHSAASDPVTRSNLAYATAKWPENNVDFLMMTIKVMSSDE